MSFFYYLKGLSVDKNNNIVGGDKIKKYPFVLQEESKDCGAACLSMIIQYYNGYLNMEKIRDLVKINKEGTTAFHIIEGAKKIGFNALGCQCDLAKLATEKVVLPVIANVIVDQKYTHFVVIYKINDRKKELIIADPANKIKRVSYDSFSQIYNRVILVMYPKIKLPMTERIDYSIKDLIPLLKYNKSLIINMSLLSFFVILFSIILSFYGQIILNNIDNGKNQITWIFIFFVIISLLKSISGYFRNILFSYISQKVELTITTESIMNILSLPYAYYRNHSSGDILTRLRDVSNIRDGLSKCILLFLIDLPLMIVSFCILCMINFNLTVIAFLIFLFYLITLRIFHTPLENTIENCQKEHSILTSRQLESINSFEAIKGLNLKKEINEQIEMQEVIFLNNLHQYQKVMMLEDFIKDLIEGVGYVIIFYLGCISISSGSITIGMLLTFQSCLAYFLNPIRDLVDFDADIKRTKKSWIRLKELFIENKSFGYINKMIDGDIKISNLTYSYDYDQKILDNVNLTIKKGDKVIITGKSGSGKSTIVKLLKKYYPVNRGLIKINDIDINDYCHNDILYVGQNEFLFTDTLINNVTINQIFEEKKLNKILKMCEIDKIVRKSNLGYFLLLEENGFNLSGGERQRIILARAIIRPFNILIIDEGLSQMDINMERRILKRLFRCFYDKTIIVISHRFDNIDLFKHHISIKDGKVFNDLIKNE